MMLGLPLHFYPVYLSLLQVGSSSDELFFHNAMLELKPLGTDADQYFALFYQLSALTSHFRHQAFYKTADSMSLKTHDCSGHCYSSGVFHRLGRACVNGRKMPGRRGSGIIIHSPGLV